MNKCRVYKFTVIELLFVLAVMLILALLVFVAVKGAKEASRKVMTSATISTCKANVENLYNYIFNESRKKNIAINEHPLFSQIWSSNKVWTFRDASVTDNGITANGLNDIIVKGALTVDNDSIIIQPLKYPGVSDPVNTLVDGWGNPILLIRNEIAWWVKKNPPNADVIDTVYKIRTKSTVGLYAYHMFSTTGSGMNMYAWNDSNFDHTDSTGVKDSSYEVAPIEKTSGIRLVGNEMYGKASLAYSTNDFDYFSAGSDGKIGNLIPRDLSQDRWNGKEREKANDINSKLLLKWVLATYKITDPDDDNIISFNRYDLQ